MIEAFDVSQVRAAEGSLMARLPDGTLMQRAATGLAIACSRFLTSMRGQVVGSRVVLLVGAGNNGGDALWAGAMLRARGCAVDALCTSTTVHVEGATALARAGGRLIQAESSEVERLLMDADLVLDGVLGIGGRGGLREPAARWVQLLHASGAFVVAVDLPSGVDADSGAVEGVAVQADATVTFGCLKPGLLVTPGAAYCGAVTLVDIGLDLGAVGAPAASVLEDIDVAAYVGKPDETAYKYSRGVVGVAAGSREYPGAAVLATAAARHANVGMVRYLDRSDGNAERVVDHFPDVVIDGSAPADQVRVRAWACGPGFVGRAEDEPTVRAVLAAHVPVVLDAGALQVVADSADARDDIRSRSERGLVTVITPHEGEFRRIFPGVLESSTGRLAAARAAAQALQAIVVLKGPGSVIAAPTGAAWIDVEGTSDLGAAGSGDVLTGIVGAILADCWERGDRSVDGLNRAVAAAVWLHGRAGRLACVDGPVVATDIAEHVQSAVASARHDAAREES